MKNVFLLRSLVRLDTKIFSSQFWTRKLPQFQFFLKTLLSNVGRFFACSAHFLPSIVLKKIVYKIVTIFNGTSSVLNVLYTKRVCLFNPAPCV